MRCARFFMIFLFPAGFLFAQQQVKATITELTDENNRGFVLLDVDNSGVQSKIANSLTSALGVQCYSQRDVSGVPTGPVLLPERAGNIIQHEYIARDFAVGISLCLAGCLFVQVAGTEKSELGPVQGFSATAGTKVVTGSSACIVGAMWATGCVFLGKGAIEIFTPKKYIDEEVKEPKKESSSRERHSPYSTGCTRVTVANKPVLRSTEQIIAAGGFKVENQLTKSVAINDVGALENWIKRYCLSL